MLERISHQRIIKSTADHTFLGVAIYRGGVDALQRGLHECEHQRGDHAQHDHDTDQDRGARYRGKRDESGGGQDQSENKQAEDQADAGVADQAFAPRALEQFGAALDCIERADIAVHEHRHDQESRERPAHADQANDPLADESGAILQRAQYHADRGGNYRVAENRRQLRHGDAKPIGSGRRAAAQVNRHRTNQRRVEKDDDEILHKVDQEHQHRAAGSHMCMRGPLQLTGKCHRQKETGGDDDRADGRQRRKYQQRFLRAQYAGTRLDQRPAA